MQIWGLLLVRAAGLLLTWPLRFGFRIAEGQKIESQMCFKPDSLIVDPPCIWENKKCSKPPTSIPYVSSVGFNLV